MTDIASGKTEILIVDDARVSLQIYTRMLRPIVDAVCITYESSAEALAWAATADPDLVFIDYRMPAPDGLEFIERFRAMATKTMTPIVMITASQELDVRHRALELGATDFLTKPADPVEFLARARNLLALRDGNKKLADHAAWLASEVRQATAELVERERESIFQLLRIAEFRDSDTAIHIVRMGHLAALLGKSMGLPDADVELLRLAAPMHDIGKVATPDRILLKPGKLTSQEWKIMQEHATAGYEILRHSKSRLLRAGAEIALTHHEKFDGSGYPQGMKADAIPLFGRITALADVFDALTSDRPYKRAWPIGQAFERIEADAGAHFDPDIVATFLSQSASITAIRLQYSDRTTA